MRQFAVQVQGATFPFRIFLVTVLGMPPCLVLDTVMPDDDRLHHHRLVRYASHKAGTAFDGRKTKSSGRIVDGELRWNLPVEAR
jgi:hypothetical protein